MANQTVSAGGATAARGNANGANATNEVRTVNVGEELLKVLQERLTEIEAEDAKLENRAVEDVNAAEELQRAKTIKYMITTDALVWRTGKPAPNMKSGAYDVLAMFRISNDPEVGDGDEGYQAVRVYLIPNKPVADSGGQLLSYEMSRDKIDFVCDEFHDVETFIGAVADDYLRAMGLETPQDEPEPDLLVPEPSIAGVSCTPAATSPEDLID